MKQKHADFSVINAVVDLLKVEKRQRWMLIDLLSHKFTRYQVEQAIETAIKIKVVKVPGLIKEALFHNTTYMLVE